MAKKAKKQPGTPAVVVAPAVEQPKATAERERAELRADQNTQGAIDDLKAGIAKLEATLGYKEFPKLLYHGSDKPRTVHGPAEQAAAEAEGWSTSHVGRRASEDADPVV